MSKRQISRKAYHSEQGYTLLEVIIAMQLGILVIGMALWSYSFSNKVLIRLQRQNSDVIQQANLEKALRTTLLRIAYIEKAEEKLLVGRTSQQDTVRVSLMSDSIHVNGKVLNYAAQLSFRYHIQLSKERLSMPSVPEVRFTHIRAIELSGQLNSRQKASSFSLLQRLIWGSSQLRSENIQ